jgi:hypothetical protein
LEFRCDGNKILTEGQSFGESTYNRLWYNPPIRTRLQSWKSAAKLRFLQILAKKMIAIMELSQQQLSKQDHYDYGLRSFVIPISRAAGAMKRTDPDAPEEVGFLMEQSNRQTIGYS